MLPAIAVFAKAPVPGNVKTRLANALGAAAAAEEYERMVDTLLSRLTEATGSLGTEIELHTDIETDAWQTHTVTRRLQAPGDLGARMLASLRRGLEAGRPRMMILGGDVPTVPIRHLRALLEADADVAIGPAEDGGYYAIACRAVHPEMFQGVAWSTAEACRQTVEACRRAGLRVFLGPMWFDVDEPSDLERIGNDNPWHCK
jgi:uncharacterized protein